MVCNRVASLTLLEINNEVKSSLISFEAYWKYDTCVFTVIYIILQGKQHLAIHLRALVSGSWLVQKAGGLKKLIFKYIIAFFS